MVRSREAFEHQIVELATLREHERRLQPVAGKPAPQPMRRVAAMPQSPGRSWMSGKNRSCQVAGAVLDGADLAHEHRGLEHLLRAQRVGIVLVVDDGEDVVERVLLVVGDFQIGLRGRALVLVDRVDRLLQRPPGRPVDLRIGVVEFRRRDDDQRGGASAEDLVAGGQHARAGELHLRLVERRGREMRVDAAGVVHQRHHRVGMRQRHRAARRTSDSSPARTGRPPPSAA